jgi:hypothetical protein
MKTRLLLGAAAALACLGCGYQPALGSPGVAGGTRVGYAVRCRECDVTYTDGASTATERMKGFWHKDVNVDHVSTPVVMLTVVPARAGIVVDHATIEINGRKVAEARNTSPGPFGDQVTLSAPLQGSD